MRPDDSARAERERKLIEQSLKGDQDAFQALIEPYAPRLFPVLLRMVTLRQTAEDLLQETFVHVFTNLSRFRGECSFYTWIYRIAVNLALKALRRPKSAVRWESLDSSDDPEESRPKQIPDWTSNPEICSQQSETGRVIEEAIASLADANRIVFTLREIDGLEYDQIAAVLECSQEAVRTRLCRAKKELKEKLRPYLENREPVKK
ncbi:MAG: sigma-70 family RNA polymerase sigma factor [Candidatus Xenobia bacterium]